MNGVIGLDGQYIGGTKGSVILLDHPNLLRQLDGRMMCYEADDGRIFLLLLIQGKGLVGSTDIPDGDPDSVACTHDETAFLIQSLKICCPVLTSTETRSSLPVPVSDRFPIHAAFLPA